MDTTLAQKVLLRKTATGTVGIIIAIVLTFMQISLISAKDLGIGNYTGLSPTLNNLVQEQSEKEKRFNKGFVNKYTNSRIVEVEKGVKHVRMIRYYNNRPVRINIVELSTNVNTNLNVVPAIASKTLASKSKILLIYFA